MRRPVLILVLALLALGLPAVASGAVSPPPQASRSITLITGDEVVLTGSQVAVRPGPGRSHVDFLQQKGSSDITVVPSDAAPLLRDGKLDPRLFNISELDRQGFTGQALPLIVSGSLPGVRASRVMASVNAVAVTAEPAVWQAALAGDARVWLDGRARHVLAESTRQVGAPAAWAAGITGKGVTIADLDGGWDPAHPDLTGVTEARDFTGTGIKDGYGHGTHTASTIGGTGAGSGGKYKGVAPDVKMLVGKVCRDDGGCPESAIIAGMEWAAAAGATAVNLSLGGAATDGTDPMSLAVNALTAQYGTLFVVAAGNSGVPGSVAAPGAADSALTVGSVTKQDGLSSFSSRGPRVGDYAIKPDIAAPGSAIVAARAAGTGMGTPVDALYTSASGTSMATPHVTGAAALLKQAHPTWKAAELKAALMASSKEIGLAVYEQGAGRLDVARALTQTVTSSPASVSFPFVAWPRTGPVTRKISYSNASSSAVTLALKLPAGPFSLGASTVVVPAGGTASVDVTLTPGDQSGQFGGALVASGDGVEVRTPLGAVLEDEKYTLSIDVIGRDGLDPWFATVQVIDIATGASHGYFFTDGAKGSVRVPKGRYDVHSIVYGNKGDRSLLSSPSFEVGGNASVRFDARTASSLKPRVDRGGTVDAFYLGLYSGNATKMTGVGMVSSVRSEVFAAPTPKVSGRLFQFWYQPVVVGADAVYNLMWVKEGYVPDPASLAVRDSQLGRVKATYQTQGGAPAISVRGGFGYYKGVSTGATVLLDMKVPHARTEFYTPGPDVVWDSAFGFRGGGWGEYQRSPRRAYAAGKSITVVWNRSPLGPSLGSYGDGWGLWREGAAIGASIPLFSTAGDFAYTESWSSTVNARTTLSRDGKEIVSAPWAGWIPPTTALEAGKYTLTTSADRPVPYSLFGTHASASWTFNAPAASTGKTPLPLMVVRASGKTDGQGLAPSGRLFVLDLKVDKQKGAQYGRVGTPRVEVSYDDGKTWQRALVAGSHALLLHPHGKAFVSLRMSVSDSLGNSATHTVLRAYEVVPR